MKAETRAGRIIRFIETYCLVPEGKHVGRPMRLAKFQKKFITAIFDNPNRLTRRAYLSIARKNGKTALIAAIVLAFVVGPEKQLNAQVISGARSRRQAALVFKLAEKMCRLSPTLTKLTRIIPSEKTIIGLVANVEYVAISAEAGTAHGNSPLLAILDEVGQVKGPQDDFIEAIETAQGAHDNPLLIAISTQAPSDGDLFSIWLDDAERSADPSIVSHVYSAPADCEVMDRRAWRAANPALGDFRSLEDVESQARRARDISSAENGFRNLTLNQRVTRFTPAISPGVWKRNNGPVDRSVFYDGGPVYGGLDLSGRLDLSALVLVALRAGFWHVWPTFWTPEATLVERAKRDRAPYDAWVRDGFMKATPGPAVEYDFVARDVRDLTAGMRLEVLAFDRWRIDILKKEFERLGMNLPLEGFGQGFVSMAPAIDAMETEFLHNRVRHGGHPVLTMNAAQAVITPDAAGNRKLDKSKSSGRIDGMVALAMALGVAVSKGDSGGGLDGWLRSKAA